MLIVIVNNILNLEIVTNVGRKLTSKILNTNKFNFVFWYYNILDWVSERTKASVVTHTGAGSNLGSQVAFFFGHSHGVNPHPGMPDTSYLYGCTL